MPKVRSKGLRKTTELEVTANTIEEIVEQKVVGGIPKLITPIEFKTKNQKRFYKAIESQKNQIVMAHALAGAGKTFVGIQKGIELLYQRNSGIFKMVIINPTVDVGNEDKLGHLPGDLMEKIAYHNESSLGILYKIIGEKETNRLIEIGNAYTKSGFYDIWKRLSGVEGVYQVEFSKEDCVRSGIVKRILERYELEEEIHLGESFSQPDLENTKEFFTLEQNT